MLFQSEHDEAARSEMTRMRKLFDCSARENTDSDDLMDTGLWTYSSPGPPWDPHLCFMPTESTERPSPSQKWRCKLYARLDVQ